MQLRAQISQPGLLFNVVQAAEKFGKTCLLRLSPTQVYIVVRADTEGSAEVWTRLDPEAIFDCSPENDQQYKVVTTAADSVVNLEVSMEGLCQALKSALPTKGMGVPPRAIMRLTSRDGAPVLSFQIHHFTQTGGAHLLDQDLPIRIVDQESAAMFKEPTVPPPKVPIVMPPLKEVHRVAERLGRMHDLIEVRASRGGDFMLGIDGDGVRVKSTWSGLPLATFEYLEEMGGTQERHDGETASTVVRARDLCNFLWSSRIKYKSVVCCILEGYALVFFLFVPTEKGDRMGEEGVLTYYLPSRVISS